MTLFYPLHYESRQGQAEGEVFPKMQFLVNAVFSCDLNNHMLKKLQYTAFPLILYTVKYVRYG